MFGRDSKADRGVGKLYGDKKEVFRCALVGSCWSRKLGAGPFCDWIRKHIEIFLVGSEQKQRLGKLAIILKVLPILICLLQSLWIGCLNWLVRCLWVRVLLLHVVWLQYLYSVCQFYEEQVTLVE